MLEFRRKFCKKYLILLGLFFLFAPEEMTRKHYFYTENKTLIRLIKSFQDKEEQLLQ